MSKQEWAVLFFKYVLVLRRRGSDYSGEYTFGCTFSKYLLNAHHMTKPIRDEEAACNLPRRSISGRLREGSVLAYLLCVKHCAFKYVPIACTYYTHLIVHLLCLTLLLYACVCVCLHAHACLCMFVCMQMCLHRDTRGQPQLLFLRCQLPLYF